jgi:hypothetical protein
MHTDIKHENSPKPASRYLEVLSIPWEKRKFEGIQIKVLYPALPQAQPLCAPRRVLYAEVIK